MSEEGEDYGGGLNLVEPPAANGPHHNDTDEINRAHLSSVITSSCEDIFFFNLALLVSDVNALI